LSVLPLSAKIEGQLKHLRAALSNKLFSRRAVALEAAEQLYVASSFRVFSDSRLIKHQQRKRSKRRAACSVMSSCVLLLLFALCSVAAQAQSISARITVLSVSPGRVRIEGERTDATTAWSFRKQYGSISGLEERIEKLTLSDHSGAQVPVRKVAPGEYSAESAANRFAYEVKLEPPAQTSDAAYVSWLTDERGILLPGDLLPRPAGEQAALKRSAQLRFVLPATWSIAANETKQADGQFQATDVERAVFLTGADMRQQHERVGQMDFSYVTSGRWAFTDEEAAKLAASILKEHTTVLGGPARQSVMLLLIPFPRPVGADRWSAETRGGTVTLLSGQSPSRTVALAQLGVPLTHELFHLWIPNGLALDGDYDWFYEGFTIYQAMRVGMRLELLTFQDYLNALGRAFDSYTSISGRDQLSLVGASEQRWKSQSGLVYHKGLIVAFLYDLTLRQQTKNNRSLDDVYRELFRRHRSSEAKADGNSAVISILKSQSGMQEFVRQFIENPVVIDLRSAVAPFGLEVSRGGVRTHLAVSDSLSRAQRDLLRKFGYNEETRRRR
jgi:predicted metalloprotease with PDZ domain